jgi:hypothetical protein
MKTILLSAALVAIVAAAGCSSNQVQPDRPVPHTSTAATPAGPQPSLTQVGTGTASNPCAELKGAKVGQESDATNPGGGKLASPPTACSAVAQASGSGRCSPAGKAGRDGHWFYFTYDGYSAFGKPGSTWHVKKGAFDQTTDIKTIAC